jgi:ACS family D-galactonate transporter-like MFS transporter
LKTIPVPQLLLLQSSGQKVVDAETALKDLASIPVPQLLLLHTSGQKVTDGEAALKDASSIPAASLGLLQKSGLTVAAAQAKLVALGSIPAKDSALLASAQKASSDSPKQWRNYFWIAVGGEIVFIPLIWLLTGFWSPRRAKKAEEDHEQWVKAELAKLRD